MKEEIRLVQSQLDPHANKNSDKAHRTCVLILGMHRSGTSALARVFNLLGCDLPKTLMGGDESNLPGHWESSEIRDFNERILKSAGSSWHDWLEFNPGWFESPKAEEYLEEAKVILHSEFGHSRFFVLKDPRICRFTPFWLKLFRETGIRPLIIIPVRNPMEVAASLQKSYGFEDAYSHLLWMRHMMDAEVASRDLPRFFTNYENLIKRGGRFSTEAQKALNITWPRLSDQSAAEIEGFLSENYRYHSETREEVVGNPSLSKWVQELFQIFSSWTEGGEKQENYIELNNIRDAFNSAAPAFSRLIAAGNKATQEVHHLSQDLLQTQNKLARIEIISADERDKINHLENELAELHNKIQNKDQQILHLQAEQKIQAHIAEEVQKNASTIQEIILQQERLYSLETELAASRQQIEKKSQQILQLEAEKNKYAYTTESARRELCRLRIILNHTESIYFDQKQQIQQLQEELSVAYRAIEEKDQNILHIQDKLIGVQEHVFVGLAESKKLEETILEQTNELKERTKEFAVAQERIFTTEEKLAESKLEVKQSLEELTSSRIERQRLSASLEEATNIAAGLKDYINLLHSDVKARHADLEAISRNHKSQLEEKEKALNEKGGELEVAKEHIAKFKIVIDEFINNSKKQESELAQYKETIDRQRSETRKLKTELESKNNESRDLRENIAQRFEEITSLTQMLREKEDEAAQMRHTAAAELGRAIDVLLNRYCWMYLWHPARLWRKKILLKNSGLFDPEWYLQKYKDVAEKGMDPLRHYILFAAKECREPNSIFEKIKK